MTAFRMAALRNGGPQPWETGEAMWVNNMPNLNTQWNCGATAESNRGPRARIPSTLTTKPLSHTTILACACKPKVLTFIKKDYRKSPSPSLAFRTFVLNDRNIICRKKSSLNVDSAQMTLAQMLLNCVDYCTHAHITAFCLGGAIFPDASYSDAFSL